MFGKALQIMKGDARINHTTVLLLDTGYGHAFHYHAQEAGARYVSRKPTDPSVPFSSETWIEFGNSKIMTVAIWSKHYKEMKQLPVTAGDRVWVMGSTPFPDQSALEKIPVGMIFSPAPSFDERIRIFEIEEEK